MELNNELKNPLVGLRKKYEKKIAETPSASAYESNTRAPVEFRSEDDPRAATTDIELQSALAVLEKHGLSVAQPKINWIKHSFELNEETFDRIMKMIPELGYRRVKDAIDEAFTEWCNKHQGEYEARCSQKTKK